MTSRPIGRWQTLCHPDPTRGRRRRRVTGGRRPRTLPQGLRPTPCLAKCAGLASRGGHGELSRHAGDHSLVAAGCWGTGGPTGITHRPTRSRHRHRSWLPTTATGRTELHEGGPPAAAAATETTTAARRCHEGCQADRQTHKPRHDKTLQRAMGKAPGRSSVAGTHVAASPTPPHKNRTSLFPARGREPSWKWAIAKAATTRRSDCAGCR